MRLMIWAWMVLHQRRGRGPLSAHLRRDIGVNQEYERWHDWNM